MEDDIELIVTSIKELSKKRRLICINYEPAFALYNSEVKEYELEENKVIPQKVYYHILDNVLKKRCVVRAMELLKVRDYTVKELVDKLKEGYYPDTIVDNAIVYVRKYGYINDERYADNYIRFKAVNKSRRQIEQQLSMKGVPLTVIRTKLEEYYSENADAELNQAVLYLGKKIGFCKEIDYDMKQKLIGYLYRKGFNIDTINKALDIVLDKDF